MKLARPLTNGLTRPAALLLSVLVLALTVISLQRAYAVVTVPAAFRYVLTVPASGDSNFVPWPATDSPMVFTGTTTTLNYRGTGFVHVTLAVAAGTPVVTWSGINAENTSTITSGFTTAGGIKLLEMGFNNATELRTYANTGGVANLFKVHNNTTVSQTVVITITY